MSKPIIPAVDSDAAGFQITEQLLRNRYGIDYTVVCEPSPVTALQRLTDWQAAGEPVAVLLAGRCRRGQRGGRCRGGRGGGSCGR